MTVKLFLTYDAGCNALALFDIQDGQTLRACDGDTLL